MIELATAPGYRATGPFHPGVYQGRTFMKTLEKLFLNIINT